MDVPPSGSGAFGSGEAPAGRRGNGLPSAEWGALVDLDPRLSEGLLQRLADAGVAAYVEPAGGTADPVSRATSLPARPLHRLWVDPSRAEAAREVVGGEVRELDALLAEQGPDLSVTSLVQPVPRGTGRVLPPPPLPGRPSAAPVPPPPDGGQDGAADRPAGDTGSALSDEEQWRLIVEGYDRTAQTPVPPWPADEDADWTPRNDASRGGSAARPLRRRTEDPLPGWVEPPALDDESHYVPPPPPPVPRIRPRSVAAAAALVLGVLLLFTPHLLDAAPGAGTTLLGMLLTGGGAGAFVWWMRDAPHDDDPDDGAVV